MNANLVERKGVGCHVDPAGVFREDELCSSTIDTCCDKEGLVDAITVLCGPVSDSISLIEGNITVKVRKVEVPVKVTVTDSSDVLSKDSSPFRVLVGC